ncbi:MAG: sialidase family protein, partial [FCB group bacterium]
MKIGTILFIFFFFCLNLNAQWEADVKLSTNEVNALTNENMGQCIGVNGNVIHVVWSDVINGNGIYYKRSTDGGTTWGPDTRISGSPSISDFPSIAVVGNNIHVDYRDSIPGSRNSNYIRSTDGGNTWGTPVSLGSYFWWPSISASDNGVFMSLNSQTTGNSEVWCRASTDNGITWNPVFQISNALGRSEDPSIAAGGGYVHLAWNDNRTGIMQTFYRRSTNLGATWGPEIQRTNTTVFAYCPVLSVSGADVDLVWGDRR